ncbi:helix-turn-helix domain-containing protein [Virgisporangium aurantiacum]|nr:helix-turn-helix transcriptional regulator [Virgisporangium aurantiacum]
MLGADADFGALLRRLRTATRLTQEGVAAGSGLSVRSIREIERGIVRYPRPDSVRRLADALGLAGEERTRFERLARAGYWTDRAQRLSPQDLSPRDLSPQPPPAPALPPRAAQLPALISDFVDRSELLAGLDGMLPAVDSAVTVVVVTGGGGSGKTTLAVRWAHGIAHRFPAGQLYVDLRGFSADPPLSPAKALSRFISALGLPRERVPADVAEAAAVYRSLVADRPVLVLLDNAVSAEQVAPLLPGCPGSVVVVTSRGPLDGLVISHGARRLTVGELGPDEALALLGRVIGTARVDAERAAAARLVAACGHLALAVRIAAARMLMRPDRSIGRYTAEFTAGNRLDALECDDAAVRRTFLHSYRRLDDGSRTVFRRLSLIAGPSFTLAATEAVSGLSRRAAGAALDRLTASHLVERVGEDRFRFHDLLRRYARERCDAEESVASREAVRSALLGWQVSHVRAAAAVLYPRKTQLPELANPGWPEAVFADRQAGLDWLDAEEANLVAAIRSYADEGPRRAVWLLGYALRGYFDLRGSSGDWLAVATLAVDAATRDSGLYARASAELSLATALTSVGRKSAAIAHALRSLAFSHEAGWDEGEATACGTLGSLYIGSAAVGAAAGYLNRGMDIFRRLGNLAGEANALDNLCTAHITLGNLESAAEGLRQALDLYRRADLSSGEGHALTRLAELHWAFDQDRTARRHANRALTAYRSAGHLVGEGYARVTLAVNAPDGALGGAIRQANHALDGIRRAGDRLYETKALNCLGNLYRRAGDAPAAHATYTRSLELARAIDDPHQAAVILVGLAQVAGADRSADHLDEAADIARVHGFRVVSADVHAARARALLARGERAAGTAVARQAADLYRATGNARGARHARELLAP